MVKVQKPQAKSLNKSNSIEGVSKNKGRPEKSKKLPKEATLELASSKKIKNAASQKNDGVKSEQKVPKKEVEKKQSKAVKRPLILAPPESPAAPPAAEKKSKAKPAVPATPVPKKKPAKRPLILAPPESPVVPKIQEKKVKAAPVAAKKDAAPAKKEAAPAKKTVQAAPTAKKPAEIGPPAKKSAQVAPPTQKPAKAAQTPKKAAKAAPPTKKPAQDAPPAKKAVKEAAPAKKPAQVAAPAKKSVQAAPPAKKSQKPAAEAANKLGKPAKDATQAKPAKAQPAAQLQKKAKSVQKLSKAPKSKKPFNKKSKAGQAKGKSVKKEPVKTKKQLELTFELKSFDEQRYKEIVTENNVTKVCQALKTLVSEEVAKKKATSIFSDYRYILQVASYKISNCPKRMVKLSLKHSLVGNTDDVALIVPDLQRGAKFESEPTKQHYEDLLREAGVKQRLTVIPFNQLRNEMGSFEAKRKFLNSYDYLLCDGRLSGQATAFLGKNTQKPRNVLHAVRLTKDKLPEEITRALNRTAFRQLAKGDLTSIPVGNDGHSAEQLAENILLVSKQLQQVFPGGLANIRSMYVKIDITGTSSLPLYVSMCAPPADTPYVVGPKEQRMLKLKKQANEVLSRFAMTKDADFIKLTSDQVKRKAELRVERAALLAADAAPKDNDGEDTAVPTKKARKESTSEGAKAEADAESDDDEEVEEAEDSAGESGEDGDDTDDDDDIDEENDDDDDEDDDEEDDDDEEEDDDDDDDDE
ncbi:ribosomal L1 domain-containing protein CG13096 [Drosophila elegans]|uniref:ribosomal L1 domain-containing protein CG13096 n=1 Tax=Drosophila elegans TaxID=30023 RepID=UPI001BC85506|nr:ribosomal L1 domain-containing protein CG13096 [Drosophila elegans]